MRWGLAFRLFRCCRPARQIGAVGITGEKRFFWFLRPRLIFEAPLAPVKKV